MDDEEKEEEKDDDAMTVPLVEQDPFQIQTQAGQI